LQYEAFTIIEREAKNDLALNRIELDITFVPYVQVLNMEVIARSISDDHTIGDLFPFLPMALLEGSDEEVLLHFISPSLKTKKANGKQPLA
jgi:hypothetical protein